MTHPLKLRVFAHSWTSDWNHGNAHFLRGLARELIRFGHDVRCYEQIDAWSKVNLLEEGPAVAEAAVAQFRSSFPELLVHTFKNDSSFFQFAESELRGADVVLVHEWNPPEVVNTILSLRRTLGFRVLFHDTHHRAYSNPKELLKLDLHKFDGILAFGEPIRRIYRDGFGIAPVWTLHEAADIAHFHPVQAVKNSDVIWVGNWGDEERTRELEEFLIEPAGNVGGATRFAVHGVRYPRHAVKRLSEVGIEYRGYLPNLEAPRAYGESLVTLHVPRRFYANGLSGIPTIRVFEAMACGIPLLCAPWTDTDGLFTAGQDYICVADGRSMESELRYFLSDESARKQLAAHALKTVQTRHTCAHRAQQLIEICEELGK